MTTDTELNSTTALVLRALMMGKDRMTAKEVAQAANIRESNVEMMLADAVDDRLLKRSRHADGAIAYTLPVVEKPAGALEFVKAAAPAKAAQPVAKRGPGRAAGERPAALPDLDISAIRVTLAPLHDGRACKPSETKWGPLFDKLAQITPGGKEYPTVELPKLYGKAIQAAARKYSKDTGIKLKVSIGDKTTVQRVA